MAKEQSTWNWRDPLHWVAAILLTATASMCLYAFVPREGWKELWTEPAAGWAQAIGSVFAIVFATRIARTQADAQHKSAMAVLREQTRVQRYPVLATLAAQARIVLAILEQLGDRLTSREDVVEYGATFWGVMGPTLRDARLVLDRLPVELLPGRAVLQATQLSFGLKAAEADIERILKPGRSLDQKAFDDYRGHLSGAIDEVRSLCQLLDSWVTDPSKGHVPYS